MPLFTPQCRSIIDIGPSLAFDGEISMDTVLKADATFTANWTIDQAQFSVPPGLTPPRQVNNVTSSHGDNREPRVQ